MMELGELSGGSAYIGDLPETWSISRIGDLASQLQYGLNCRGEAEGEYAILRMNCQLDGRVVMRNLQYVDLDPDTATAYRVNKGDLLFNRTNSYELVGRTAIMGHESDAVFASYLVRVVVDRDRVDPRFLNFFLNGNIAQEALKMLASRGVSQANISAGKLREFLVPVPPLEEQRPIADALDLVRSAIEIERYSERLAEELKDSVLTRLFRCGLRGEDQKETEIGLVPNSWKLTRLGDIYETQLGKMLSQKARGGDSPKPYLRNKNVQWGRLDMTDLFVMDFDERETKKFRLMPGDLLICEGGVIGRAAIWRGELEECYYQKALHRVRPRSKAASNEFLCHWLSFAFEHQNLYTIGGASSTIAHLPQVLLDGLKIPLPAEDEQREIVTVFDAIDQKIAVHRKKIDVLERLFQSLLHKLMTGQIRISELRLSSLPAIRERLSEVLA